MNNLPRAQWSSYYNYVLVTTGAVVGLGNIFQFPFLVTQYGGLFVLFFVLSELFITLPIFFSELLIGRRGKQNPVGAISILSMESLASPNWRLVGWLCFIILFLTLSYYTVMVAFPLSYLVDNVRLLFQQSNSITINISSHFFLLELCFFLFLMATLIVVVKGINRGLEGISRITIPTYFVILFVLALYASVSGDFIGAVKYLFHVPEHQAVLPVFLAALTFAFFNLNVGMGSMMVYGSYLPYDVPLAQSTIIILLLDALASILSYFIICPLMLSSHLVTHDVTLTYQNVMMIFANAPHGVVIATFFFLVAVIMAWTPTIAMAESAVLTLIERFHISRVKSTAIIAIGSIFMGTLFVLSNTVWSNTRIFSNWNIADFIQNFASDIATPISAFLIAIFAGWIVKRSITENELEFKPFFYTLWRLLIRYLAPVSIVTVLLLVGFN